MGDPRTLIFRALRKQFHGPGRTAWVGHSTMASDCHQCLCALEVTLAVLDADDRLLPSGGEVREEWVARWTPNAEMAAQGYEVELIPPGSRQRAEQYARRLHEPDDGVVELLRQRTYIGPWEVVSDTSEKAATQWMIRDADGLESDYASDEREIRQSWAQGITWWDPEGSYELCRREGPDAPWEVVERHPVVSGNSEVPDA